MTIQIAYHSLCKSLETIYESKEAESIARIVFEDAFQVRNFQRQDKLTNQNILRLGEIEKRLLKHEPVQYIFELADFYGLKFKVNKHVLIPRQETEELVLWILEEGEKRRQGSEIKVLDIGTGSGCIPITLKKKMPHWRIDALDISEQALIVAKENAIKNDVEINFFQLDILNEVLWSELGHYDIIVSNPPYIPENEEKLMPENVLAFEPHLALFVKDGNPSIFYERIAQFAVEKLNHCGKLFFETNEFNAKQILQIVENMDFTSAVLKQDLNGKNRMVSAEIRII